MFSYSNLTHMAKFSDLQFPTIGVVCRSSGGTPFLRYMRFGLPKIPRNILRCAVFLYNSPHDALNGADSGGTGFVVAMPTVVSDKYFCYIVTNWHVAVSGGSSVVRLPLLQGGIDVFDFEPHDWFFLPAYDIAVIPIMIDFSKHDVTAIQSELFLDRKWKAEVDIGPGDDVFMIGRFVDHGASSGIPSVRFGNISNDPAPMRMTNGSSAESYCVDMHSRTGYSGSPVFVCRTPGYDLGAASKDSSGNPMLLASDVNHLSLLGLHWGQFPEIWEVTASGALRSEVETREPLVTNGRYIRGFSGMTCVHPAWSILEVLNMDELVRPRDQTNATLAHQANTDPKPESAITIDGDTTQDKGDEVLQQMLNTPPKPKE